MIAILSRVATSPIVSRGVASLGFVLAVFMVIFAVLLVGSVVTLVWMLRRLYLAWDVERPGG